MASRSWEKRGPKAAEVGASYIPFRVLFEPLCGDVLYSHGCSVFVCRYSFFLKRVFAKEFESSRIGHRFGAAVGLKAHARRHWTEHHGCKGWRDLNHSKGPLRRLKRLFTAWV